MATRSGTGPATSERHGADGAGGAPGGRARPGASGETAGKESGESAGDKSGETAGEESPRSTRDRILDIALRLFTERGFDATSLQDIADELGFTKAALYYHFHSKDDILRALHMRMHDFAHQALSWLDEGAVTIERWEMLLSGLIDEMLAQRPLFLMHERNQAVMERLHRDEHHDEAHEDLHARLRLILSDPAIPLRDRLRMSCSFGAILSVVFVGGDALDADAQEVASILRDAIHDLLRPSQ